MLIARKILYEISKMTMLNTNLSYGTVAKILHWLVGIMIIAMLAVGFTMVNITPSSTTGQIYALHKATGFVVLIFVSIRLLWRLANATVELSDNFPKWQKKAFQVNIALLYILMFTMPLSGFLMTAFAHYDIDVYGLFRIQPFVEKNITYATNFRFIHQITAYIFCVSIGLHLMAALYHQFIKREKLINRML